MTTLALTFADIFGEISNFLGLGLAPAGDNLTLAKKYANDGYRMFLAGADPRTGRAYSWSFLAPAAALELWPSVAEDAAVTVTGVYSSPTGLTTLTAGGGAPFLPSMEGRTIAISGIGSFTIRGYVSAGVATVAGDATCSGKAFSIAADGAYGLPSDFAAILDDPVSNLGSTLLAAGGGTRVVPRSAAFLRQLQAAGIASGPPQYYAVLPRAFQVSQGQRYDLLLWPAPSAACTLRYRYRVEPAALSADADVPLGGPQHALTILQSGLAVAEGRHNDTIGVQTQRYGELLAASIDLDAANKAHNLGDSGGGVGGDGVRTLNPVTYP